jgi:hypothetical protein
MTPKAHRHKKQRSGRKARDHDSADALLAAHLGGDIFDCVHLRHRDAAIDPADQRLNL